MSIRNNAMMVEITFGLPRQTVKLEAIARQLEVEHGAQSGVIGSSGYYFKRKEGSKRFDGLKTLRDFQSGWRTELQYFARYPFAGGFKILPAALYDKFMETHDRFLLGEQAVWDKWALEEYSVWATSAPQRMGDLFNLDDFPSLEDCRNRFVCQVDVRAIAAVDQWRHITSISPDIAATMQAREEEAVARVTRESHAQLWRDIMGPLKNMVEQLGKDKTRIHETLIEHVMSITSLIPAYNAVVQDPAMNQLAEQVQLALASISTEDLRNDASIRSRVLEDAKRLVSEFNPYAVSLEVDDDDEPAVETANP